MIKGFNEYLMESEGSLTPKQKNWLDRRTSGTWRVNSSTGLVDVDGSLDCSNSGIKTLQGVRFGRVSGNFNCSNNQLTSLKGAPREVKGLFYCDDNQITSLKGIPFVNGDIYLDPNPIWDLISSYWKQIESMDTRSRNLVMQMIGQLETPTAEDIARIVRSVERMDMI